MGHSSESSSADQAQTTQDKKTTDIDMAELQEVVNNKIKERKVVLITKSFCPHSKKARGIFKDQLIDKDGLLKEEDYMFWDIDLEGEDKMNAIQDIMKEMTSARSVPRVFIDGAFFGGADDTVNGYESGALQEKLK